jgi:hypothetical protein
VLVFELQLVLAHTCANFAINIRSERLYDADPELEVMASMLSTCHLSGYDQAGA